MKADPPNKHTLIQKVKKGGSILLLRQVLTAGISFIGMLVLVRALGPAQYGLYATAFAIVFFAQTMGEMSLDVYMVRFPGELTDRIFNQLFTLLFLFGFLTQIILLIISQPIGIYLNLPDITQILYVMSGGIVIMNLQQTHLSSLERNLDYSGVGIIEVLGQFIYFAIALPIAIQYQTVWAPVAGWWAQQICLMIGYWLRCRYLPKLVWDKSIIMPALHFGVASTSSAFVNSARTLANPILVGSLLGASAVGVVALAIRLLEQASLARQVINRMTYAIFAKVANDGVALRNALSIGSRIQLLAVVPPVCGISLFGHWLIPLFFGNEWTAVTGIIPLFALSYLSMAAFSLLSVALSLQERPWNLVLVQSVATLSTWLVAWLTLPKYGVAGAAIGEIASMSSWIIANFLLTRHVPRPDYNVLIMWLIAAGIVATAPLTSYWMLLIVPAILLWPSSRRELQMLTKEALNLRTPRSVEKSALGA